MNLSQAINLLIAGQNLSRDVTYQCFESIIKNEVSSMDQGGFLAALTSKGATPAEIAAIRQAICDLDTEKVSVFTDKPLAENSGTGMDTFKTFNISTAASVTAAACGVAMARHGSRGITSKCGTIDVAEALGVAVEIPVTQVGKSIEQCGLGLFNGMSPLVHPRGLARILGECSFGTVLNIAASLANPVSPVYGIRGVNDPAILLSTAQIMKNIGYKNVFVMHGYGPDDQPAIDEASTIGKTAFTFINSTGKIISDQFMPEDLGLTRITPEAIATTGDPKREAIRLTNILSGKGSKAETEIVALNAAIILTTTELAENLQTGLKMAFDALHTGKAKTKLNEWINAQQREPVELKLNQQNIA